MAVQQELQVMVSCTERLLIHHYQPHRAPLRLSDRVKERALQIRRSEGVIPELAELGSQQRTVPLIGHHQQHSRRKIINHDSRVAQPGTRWQAMQIGAVPGRG